MRSVDGSLLAGAAGILSLMNRRRSLPIAPERIGIIQPTAIGDLLIGSGAIAAIAEHYPDARLTVFHGASNAAAVRLVDAELTSTLCDFSSPGRALATLRSSKLDLLVDLTPWVNLTAILARLSSPCVVGFAPPGAARGSLFDVAVPHRSDRHELANLAEMAKIFGAAEDYRMRIRFVSSLAVSELPLDRLVVCHLSPGGSRASEKAWPLQHWAVLCTELVGAGYVPAFTGLLDDQATIDELRARLGAVAQRTISLCGRIPFTELGDLLRRARLVVSVDTSVLHLAGAVGANVIGLHGPTRSWRWGARSLKACGLDSPHPDAGYISYGFETNPRAPEIMAALVPASVVNAAFDALRQGEVLNGDYLVERHAV
jgi:ADP-heptose:LPS heptosyltransferase